MLNGVRTMLTTLIVVLLAAVAGLSFQLRKVQTELGTVTAQKDVAVEARNRLMALRTAEEAILARVAKEKAAVGASRLSQRARAAEAPASWAQVPLPLEVEDALR